ncbi:MAG TPA: SpoIID/LytB domain-containing protein [Clostridiales bacterium]|nr:SpoIID/LytB domain-containing protein [Clostridiales bacterium]
MSKKFIRLTVLFTIFALALSFVGCRVKRMPPPSEGQRDVKPDIPERIRRGANQEPRLKVYLADEKTVKQMNLEEYLYGVVAGEMKNTWPEKALAAQAIIARTFVLNFVSEKGGSKYSGADISTDIEEAQAWNMGEVNDKIRKAVDSTRGKVIVHNNQFINAWFHAHAGGKTATAKEGLNYDKQEPPYIHVVNSPDSPEAPREDSNWSAVYTKQEVINALGTKGMQVGDFDDITISQRGPSGRATMIKFGQEQYPAAEVRLALDSTKMKSTLIDDIQLQGDKVVIRGRGYGHGVGMSQWGAFAMAKQGKSSEDIINHYFRNVKVVKMWE